MYFFCSFPSSQLIIRKVVWFQWHIYDDVMSYDGQWIDLNQYWIRLYGVEAEEGVHLSITLGETSAKF